MVFRNQLFALLACGLLLAGLPGCGKKDTSRKRVEKVSAQAEEQEAREILRQTSQKSSGGFFR